LAEISKFGNSALANKQPFALPHYCVIRVV